MSCRKIRVIREIDYDEYYTSFKGKEKEAFKIADINGNYSTENYWKRANYYWLFQASVFIGYFYSVTAEDGTFLRENPLIMVGITCIGFLTALAWYLVTRAGRQRYNNWDKHTEMLEDKVTGPLNKITINKDLWSTFNITEIVCLSFCIMWGLLGLKTICYFWQSYVFAYLAYILVLGLMCFIFCWFGKIPGKVNEDCKKIKLYRREI